LYKLNVLKKWKISTYQDENHGNEELNSESLSNIEVFIQWSHSETGCTTNIFRGQKLKNNNFGKLISVFKRFCCCDRLTSVKFFIYLTIVL
jgi:hypothetical protein